MPNRISRWTAASSDYLAEELKRLGLTGQPRGGRRGKNGKRITRPMSKTAIRQLRRERARLRQVERRRSVADRLRDHLTARYVAEIWRRGGETTIEGKDNTVSLRLVHRDPRTRLAVLHAEGWRWYSHRYGHARASLSYLCGQEDGQDWAVRIPGTITHVADALRWLTPADVFAAQSRGRRVVRQGDVYAIETTRAHDGKGDLPENHVWDAASRTLSHPQHGTLHLPYPVRFVPQNAYGMGRGAGRDYAD